MIASQSLLALLAFVSTALAIPAPVQLPDLAVNALDFSLSAASRIGSSGDAHTKTVWSFVDCGVPSDAISIKSFRVHPDPPKAGHKLTIFATGTVKQLIDEGANADVVVKLGLIKLLSRRFDICEELRNANATLQCPVKPGEYEITQSVDLPSEIPKAKFLVETRAFTQPPEISLACADIAIDFLRPGH